MGNVKGIVSVAGAVILLSSGIAFAQAQSKDQQGCINALNKDGAKVGATQGKENTGCIKNAGKAGGAGSQACLVSDSKGKVGKAAGKTQADFDKKCTTETPTTGVPGVFTGTAQAVNAANIDREVLFVGDVFGVPLDNAIVTDKGGAKCQATVSKDSEKTFATYMKGFLKCKKSTLKSGGNLENCVLDDPGGKAASTVGKLSADIGKKCTENIFPGLCADEPLGNLANCIGDRVACRVCEAQNSMDGLFADCDSLDDGVVNGSCSAGRPVECTLTNSSFNVQAELGTIPVPAVGSIDIATGGSSGVNSASCSIRTVEPFSLAGVGFVCLAPATGCPAISVDCDGNGTGGVGTTANRNIGACTSQADCLSQCDAFCPGISSAAASTGYGCEGFCSAGTHQACTTDDDCAAAGEGACYGQDGVPAGNICECICVNENLGAANNPGDLSCNLGVAITVEVGSPCGDGDTLIDFGTACTPLSTNVSAGVYSNFNLGGQIVEAGNGQNLSCLAYDANITSGMSLEGFVPFFGSTLGDLLTNVDLTCN